MTPEFTADWFSHHIPIWNQVVLPRLPSGRRRWLELGSHEGRSALWTLDNALRDGDELVCVDLWRGAAAHAEQLFGRNVGGRVTKVKGQIRDHLLACIAAGEKFSCIYIDGDHCGRATLEHAVLSWMLLSPGGLLIFDDYRYIIPAKHAVGRIDTKAGIDAFLDTYCLQLQILHRAAQVIVTKTA